MAFLRRDGPLSSRQTMRWISLESRIDDVLHLDHISHAVNVASKRTLFCLWRWKYSVCSWYNIANIATCTVWNHPCELTDAGREPTRPFAISTTLYRMSACTVNKQEARFAQYTDDVTVFKRCDVMWISDSIADAWDSTGNDWKQKLRIILSRRYFRQNWTKLPVQSTKCGLQYEVRHWYVACLAPSSNW